MQAPEFRLRDQNGNAVSLEQFRGKKVVLYFYPKAETPGCTVEACGMRDSIRAFSELNAVVLGVSPDEPEDLKSFERNHDLNFPLLSDPAHETAEKYDVWKEKSFMGRRFMGVARTTFLIDEQGTIVKRYDNVNPVAHASQILTDLGAKPRASTRRPAAKAKKKATKRPVARAGKKAPKKATKRTARKTAKRAARKTAAKSTKSRSSPATKRRAPARRTKRPVKKAARKRATVRGRR